MKNKVLVTKTQLDVCNIKIKFIINKKVAVTELINLPDVSVSV